MGVLHTATNYGEAEKVLSVLDTLPFRVVTKATHLNKELEAVLARVRGCAGPSVCCHVPTRS